MGGKRASRSAGRYLKNDKKNLKLPIIFLVLVLIVVAILIIHNLKTSNNVTTDVKKEVENAINDTFTALKSANPENVNKYIDYDIPLHWNAMVIESEEIYVWWYGKISRYINKGKTYVTD